MWGEVFRIKFKEGNSAVPFASRLVDPVTCRREVGGKAGYDNNDDDDTKATTVTENLQIKRKEKKRERERERERLSK